MGKRKEHVYQPGKDVHRITLYSTVYPEHQYRSKKDRLYLHFDFACFYAQIEQLRNNIYGIPLIVGGWRKENGTVKGIAATSSYEARAYGIKTGMSALEAYKLCPYVCMKQVDYAAYSAIGQQVHHIMKNMVPVVERYSMDEYFMELTFMKDRSRKEIGEFARELQRRIYDATYLVGAVGIARSKTYAKLSSSLEKPKGVTVIISDEEEKARIYPLPVNEVWGVGSRRHEHILAEGFKTIGDVAERGSVETFQRLFGANFGKMLYINITGKDQGRVMDEITADIEPKHGVSYGHTFSEGSSEMDRVKGEFAIAIQQLCYRMRAYGIRANSFSGVLGYNNLDLPSTGFCFVTEGYTNIDDYIYMACMDKLDPLLERTTRQNLQIRNLVLGTHRIDKTNQMNLFFSDEEKFVSMYQAFDEIKNRYGRQLIQKANTLLHVEGNTHFLERNS